MPKRGRNEPKAKGPHHHLISIFFLCLQEYYQLVFLLCSKGEESSISKIIKTLLNTKRRISFRGSFVESKEKHLK
jgi:hypothetical protein